MISDVLSDAVHQIEDYEERMPDVYGDPEVKARIAVVKSAMLDLQRFFDAPPGVEPLRDKKGN